MSTNTGIEWTDATWNPIRGCSRVSEGCRNCYAERVAYRFSGAGQPYEGLAQLVNGHAAWTGKVDLVEKHLLDPLKWGANKIVLNPDCPESRPAGVHGPGRSDCICTQRPRRIFVNSMSDLFHPNVPDEWIDRIFAVMALSPQHTFQVLTKRPERMLAYLRMLEEEKDMQRWINAAYDAVPHLSPCAAGLMEDNEWPLKHVHLGVSVEDQKTADERIPLLLETPAAVRFISAEPLLGAVRLDECAPYVLDGDETNPGIVNAFNALCWHPATCVSSPTCEGNDRGIRWVICGGESGPGARPMHPDWARGLRDQCVAAGVPFFFKQWGEWAPTKVEDTGILGMPDADWSKMSARTLKRPECAFGQHGDLSLRVGKKAAGSLLDGREWKEFPR